MARDLLSQPRDLLAEPQQAAAPKYDTGSPVVESLLQGPTFGYSDEMQAALGALWDRVTGSSQDLGKSYRERQQAIEGAYRAYQKEHPVASFAGEAAGGIAGGVGIARALPAGVNRIPGLIKYPGAGAAAGALAGSGTASPGERLAGAGEGAAIGAAVGGAVPLLTKAAGAVVKRASPGTSRAARKVSEAFARDEITPQRAAARLAKLGPDATLADVGGENVLGLTRAASSIPGKAKNQARRVLDARNLKQAERVMAPLERALGEGGDFYAAFDDLVALRRAGASQAYDVAYARDIPMTDRLRELVGRPSIQKALARVKQLAAEEGQDIPELDFNRASLSTKGWDYVKRSLDDVISSEHKNSITGRVATAEGRAAQGTLRALRDELDRLNPTYREARALYAGPTQSMEAMEAGRRFIRNPAEVTLKEIGDLTDGDKAFFRQGAARAARELVESVRDTNDVTKRLFGTESMRKKLRAVFPDDRSFREFQAAVLREARKFETRAAVTGNSVTAKLQAEQADLGAEGMAGALLDLGTGRPGAAAGSIIRNVARRAERTTLAPREAEMLSDLLLNPKVDVRALGRRPPLILQQPALAGSIGLGNVLGGRGL